MPAGQVEAAQALGLGRGRIFRRIVLPQAMPAIVPASGNLLIGMLKATSIVSVIAVQDLLYSAQLIYNQNFQIIPLLLVATIWYIVLTTVLSIGQYFVERRYARGTNRRGGGFGSCSGATCRCSAALTAPCREACRERRTTPPLVRIRGLRKSFGAHRRAGRRRPGRPPRAR